MKPIKQRHYRLNLRYKECVKAELDRMLEDGIIELVEESEWIIPMVVQDKKMREIWIYVDLSKLNDVSIHVPFPTPFTNKVLEEVGGQEIYSFLDDFLGYHQIKIVKEDNDKDLCRNPTEYTNNHRNKHEVEITLHFINQRTETCLHRMEIN